MRRRHFEVEETAITILADGSFFSVAEESIFRSRDVIKRFIRSEPLFGVTLEPYRPGPDAPPLVVRMCDAAEAAGVGPMAAVAGAIAERAVMDMRDAGAEQAVVDNGGDIAFLLKEETTVALYAGESVQGLGFMIAPRDGVFGMCTSSATIGPSISFGMADAATVIAENVALADACATRLGNLVTDATDEVMSAAVSEIVSVKGIDGALAAAGGRIAMRGRMPELIRVAADPSKITKVEFLRNREV